MAVLDFVEHGGRLVDLALDIDDIRQLRLAADDSAEGVVLLARLRELATQRGTDPALRNLRNFVAGLRTIDPRAHLRAMERLPLAESEDQPLAVGARQWLANLQRFLYVNESVSENHTQESRLVRIEAAEQRLDAVVFGHPAAKQRILALVDAFLRQQARGGRIIALSGPHGNGKTSLLTQGLAPALDIPSYVIDMAGMQRSDQLLGNLPVYLGAEPGKVADALMTMQSRRGLLVFDEIEKASVAAQDAVANIVDVSRNRQFETTYFAGIPVNLTNMTFAFTINDSNRLSRTLQSRLSAGVIQTHALTEDEKMEVAVRFLVPKAIAARERPDISFSRDALTYLIRDCTDEGGVRQLGGHISSLVDDLSLAMTRGCAERVITLDWIRRSNLQILQRPEAVKGQPYFARPDSERPAGDLPNVFADAPY